MIPATYNIKIWKGSTKDLEFRFPFNLTGHAVNIVCRFSGKEITIPFILSSHSSSPVVWAAKATLNPRWSQDFQQGRKISYELRVISGDRSITYVQGSILIEGSSSGV